MEDGGVIRTSTNAGGSINSEPNSTLLLLGDHTPSNVNYVVFGTALLWFGWAGFNGGSALGGNMRAVSAWTSTHIAACAGGVTGMLWIWLLKSQQPNSRGSDPAAEAAEQEGGGQPQPANRSQGNNKEDVNRLSIFYFCDGAIAGLVAITPGAGYVAPMSAAVFGIVSAFVVLVFFKKIAASLLRNDPLQIFAVHAGGGLVGMALTAFFANPDIIGLDGHSTIPHPEYTMGPRLGFQLVDGLMGMAYTFLVTLVILYVMKLLAGILHIPSHSDEEWNILEDEYQATMAQCWRSGLDGLGRPRLPVTTITSPRDRPESAGPEHVSEGAHETGPDLGPPQVPGSTADPSSSGISPIHTPGTTSPSLHPMNDLQAFVRSPEPSVPPVHRGRR